MRGALARSVLFAAACAAALAVVAWASPAPGRVTDREIYETTAERVIVRDCSDLQCFRVLVPWMLGRLPGSSTLRWKAYAVASNAMAAAAVLSLCVTFGLSRRTAVTGALLSAFGFGSLYTLHDPFTSDPLMYAIGPFATNALMTGHLAPAAAAGVAGVLAKEFAAAPLYAFAAYAAIERRWRSALGAFAAANAAFLTWAALTLTLMLAFNYGYGWNGNGSADFAHGAALALWLRFQTARGVAAAMFNEFGALWLLAPVGLLLAPAPLRRLFAVSLPIAAVFCYVQQPDRALWNFHYLVTPLAAIVLEQSPQAVAGAFLAAFAIGNLRVGAQLPVASVAHLAIAVSVLLAAAVIVTAARAARGHATRSPLPAGARS
jgi:hypothetical protein